LNQVLTDKIWREVAKRVRLAPTRKAAIAYITTDDIGFRAGDVLITDASERAIRSGQTDAKLLRKLHDEGVIIYNREGLHSKVALFGRHAIVGSANMSGSDLIEASVITDNPVIASGVAAFIEMLSTKRSRLDAARIAELCAIKVIRTGLPKGRRKRNPVRQIGKSTWIVSVRELKSKPSERQQKRIDRRNQEHAASPMPETRQPERLVPRATSNRNGGRDHLGILGEIKSEYPGEIKSEYPGEIIGIRRGSV